MPSQDRLPFLRTPLASGSMSVAGALLLTALQFFRHSPLPDAPPGNARKQFDAIMPGPATARDGVHLEIPQGWTFTRYAHSPQLLSHITVPGMGQVPVAPQRSVLFAAARKPGTCAAILERDQIRQMDLDEDAATIKRTVQQSAYARNVFDWFLSNSGDRFTMLVNAADEMLNRPEPAKRTIEFKVRTDLKTSMGRQAARELRLSANLNGRERAGLLYVVAHKDQWQYALIGVIGEPPRLCTTEIIWIQTRLSFD